MTEDHASLLTVLRALSRALDDAAATLGRNVADAAADASPWLDGDAAARHAACSRRALAEARRRGELPAHRVGRGYVYTRAAVDTWVASRAVALPSAANDVDAYAASLAAVRRRRGGR